MSLIKTSLAVAGVVAIVGSVVLYNKNPELFSSLTSGFSGSSSPNAVSAKKADSEKETRDLTADPEGYLTKARKSADKSLARMKELEAALPRQRARRSPEAPGLGSESQHRTDNDMPRIEALRGYPTITTLAGAAK